MHLNETTAAWITNATLIKIGNKDQFNQTQQRNVQINAPSVSHEARIFLICLYATIFILGVTGNAVVCWAIGRKKQMSGIGIFMVSLAFADLLASVFVPLLTIHDFLSNLRWHLGSVMCKILPFISPISLAASSWSQVLISVDRYRVIVSSMESRASNTIKLCGIVFTWAIAIGTSVPYMLFRYQLKLNGEYFCVSIIPLKQIAIYAASLVVIGWVIPISITAVLYGLCIRKLLKSICNNDTIERRILEDKKVITMFILIGILFCICTLPYAIFYMTINFLLAYKRNDVDAEVIQTLHYSLFALSSVNSCVNPVVYATKQPDVKRFVKKLLRKLCLCCKAARLAPRNVWHETYEMPPVYNRNTQMLNITEIATANYIPASSSQDKAFKTMM